MKYRDEQRVCEAQAEYMLGGVCDGRKDLSLSFCLLGDTGGPLWRSHQPPYVLTEFIHGKRGFTRLNGLKVLA